MPTTNRQRIKNKIGNLGSSNDRVVLILCFVLALLWWSAGTMSDMHTHEASVPIDLDLPESYALLEPIPEFITAVIQGSGWDLVGARKKMQDLTIKPTINRTGTNFLSSQMLIQSLNEKLKNTDFEIVSISNDGLSLEIDERITKELDVNTQISYQLEPGKLLLHMPSLDPNRVQISGPAQLLNEMNVLQTESLDLGKLDATIAMDISVYLPEPSLFDLSSERLILNIEIEDFTEKALLIPVQLRPENTHLRIFPDQVLCKVNVGLSRYDELQPRDFSFFVNTATANANDQLIIEKGTIPEYVQYIDHSPKIVDYLIDE